MVTPVVYTERDGHAPQQVAAKSVPHAVEMHAYLVEQGLRAVYVMTNHGTQESPPERCCYGSAGE